MGILFPIIDIFALAFIVYGHLGITRCREAILSAVTVLGFFVVISNELLGTFHCLSPMTIQWLWVLITLSLGILSVQKWSTRGFSFSNFHSLSLTPFEWTCVAILLSVLVATAFIAFVSPPNNWDSMTYHLPRIMHWATQQSLQNFPTDIPRQNQYPPGAEYILLHIFLLSSNDQWFNFLQWGGLVGSCLGVSLIAWELGAECLGQLLAAVVSATVPMAILQATSTQTDLIESFWLVVAVLFALRCRKNWSWFSASISCIAFAIGILTKGTFFIAVPILVATFSGCHLLWKEKILLVAVFISILVCVNGNFWLRENIFEGQTTKEFIVDKRGPSSLVFNALRHASVHLILPWKQDFVGRSELLLGAHKLLNEDNSSLEGIVRNPTGVRPAVMALDEDYAGNFIHFFLYLICFLSLIFLSKNKALRKFSFWVVLGGTLFIFFKWQEFISRMHLPIFILFAPVVGVFFEKKLLYRAVILFFLIFSAVFFVVSNDTRPLVGHNRLMQGPRIYYYFMKKPFIDAYAQASRIILSSQCTDVGLIEGGDSWEYPLWAFTGYGYVKFYSISKTLNSKPPCLVVTVDAPHKNPLLVEGFSYTETWENFPLQIFTRIN